MIMCGTMIRLSSASTHNSLRLLALCSALGAGACGGGEDGGLVEMAPTKVQELQVDGGQVRVAPLGDAIVVAWQDSMAGTTTLARYDAALAEVWRVSFGTGLPLRLRVRDGRIHVLGAEELFVFDADGAMVGQWPVAGAVDFALTDDRLVALRSDAVVELDAAGLEVGTYPVAPGFMSPWALEASAAGYCATGVLNDADTTTCFAWDGTRSPVSLEHPGTKFTTERDFVALTDEGIVSTLTATLDGLSVYALRLADGGYVGEYGFEHGRGVSKVLLGPGERTMWLELEEWCDDNCHIGFRLGLLDDSASTAIWRTDLFQVTGTVGNTWTAVADGDRVLVATDRAVFVVSNEPE